MPDKNYWKNLRDDPCILNLRLNSIALVNLTGCTSGHSHGKIQANIGDLLGIHHLIRYKHLDRLNDIKILFVPQ